MAEQHQVGFRDCSCKCCILTLHSMYVPNTGIAAAKPTPFAGSWTTGRDGVLVCSVTAVLSCSQVVHLIIRRASNQYELC